MSPSLDQILRAVDKYGGASWSKAVADSELGLGGFTDLDLKLIWQDILRGVSNQRYLLILSTNVMKSISVPVTVFPQLEEALGYGTFSDTLINKNRTEAHNSSNNRTFSQHSKNSAQNLESLVPQGQSFTSLKPPAVVPERTQLCSPAPEVIYQDPTTCQVSPVLKNSRISIDIPIVTKSSADTSLCSSSEIILQPMKELVSEVQDPCDTVSSPKCSAENEPPYLSSKNFHTEVSNINDENYIIISSSPVNSPTVDYPNPPFTKGATYTNNGNIDIAISTSDKQPIVNQQSLLSETPMSSIGLLINKAEILYDNTIITQFPMVDQLSPCSPQTLLAKDLDDKSKNCELTPSNANLFERDRFDCSNSKVPNSGSTDNSDLSSLTEFNSDSSSEYENNMSISSNMPKKSKNDLPTFHSSSDSDLSTKKFHQEDKAWSYQEVILLKEGVKKFGDENWEKILALGGKNFKPCRTCISLASKWYRLMYCGNSDNLSDSSDSHMSTDSFKSQVSLRRKCGKSVWTLNETLALLKVIAFHKNKDWDLFCFEPILKNFTSKQLKSHWNYLKIKYKSSNPQKLKAQILKKVQLKNNQSFQPTRKSPQTKTPPIIDPVVVPSQLSQTEVNTIDQNFQPTRKSPQTKTSPTIDSMVMLSQPHWTDAETVILLKSIISHGCHNWNVLRCHNSKLRPFSQSQLSTQWQHLKDRFQSTDPRNILSLFEQDAYIDEKKFINIED